MAGEAPPSVAAFGSLLREYRTAANLTQEELAGRCGLSVHAIGMLERGVRRAPRPSTVELLARGLRLDMTQRSAFVAVARGRPIPARLRPNARKISVVAGGAAAV